jgi:hypothetical protein
MESLIPTEFHWFVCIEILNDVLSQSVFKRNKKAI